MWDLNVDGLEIPSILHRILNGVGAAGGDDENGARHIHPRLRHSHHHSLLLGGTGSLVVRTHRILHVRGVRHIQTSTHCVVDVKLIPIWTNMRVSRK